jgi:hypothetical protein
MRSRVLAGFLLTAVMAAGIGAARGPEAGQDKGRYKKDGSHCVWDANDSGPNQCTPRTAGRFKKNGDACVWDAADRGPDQCTPPSGRWKTDGDRCVFDARDSGPNQCNPRQPR